MKTETKSHNYWRHGRNIMTGALAAAVMATIGASQAQAVDTKLYPASMCVRYAGSTPVIVDSRIFNPGTSVMRLDCPAIHDAAGIQSGTVDVIDRNFAGDSVGNANTQVCAQLTTVSQVLSSVVTMRVTPRRCTTGASSVSKRLFFGSLTHSNNEHYFYSVSIPPTFNGQQSAIITYRVVENN